MEKKNLWRVIIYLVLFVALVVGLTLLLLPYFRQLEDPANQQAIKEWVDRLGFWGLLAMVGVQMLQVIVAFIPGEPVEILAGALYGTFGGLFLCLFGCVCASSLIFLLSRRFGKKMVNRLFGEQKVASWKWIQDGTRCDTVTFLLFFIPGTPKDMLTYFMGITEMSLWKFLLISTFARIPSVITSTMMGASMRRGDWVTTLIIFAATGVVGILGILFKDKVIDFCKRRFSAEKK